EPVVTRPSLWQLLALALPVVVSRSAQVVISVTDAAMVSELGENALAATTTGGMNTFNVLVLPMGIVFIVQTFAAQLMGRGDVGATRRFAWYGLGIAMIAELMCLLSWPFIGNGVDLFGFSVEVKALMTSYLQVRLLTGGAAIGLEALGAWYGGLGNTRLPMITQIIAMVLNVALNWVLVTGRYGFPALGVQGSALASALATLTAFIVLFALFMLKVGMPKTDQPTGRLSVDEFVRLLRFGVPSGFNWFIEFMAFSFFINAVLPTLGTTAVAAMMSVMELNQVAFMPAFAIATSGAIFVGQAIGADRRDDVGRTVLLAFSAAVGWEALMALAYFIAPTTFLAPFVSQHATPEAAAHFLAVGASMLVLSCAWQLVDAASMVFSEALRAAGDTTFTFLARLVIAWVVFVPGAWLTIRVYGGTEKSAVLWLAGYLGLLALVLWLRFKSGAWRTIQVTEDVLA
ncbi:MAG TPA: MATE family efflux transporter, partial [Myxococcota bacterium]